MKRIVHPENPGEMPQAQFPKESEPGEEARRETNFPPSPPQPEKLEDLAGIPEAPRKQPATAKTPEVKSLLRPAGSVEELVKIIGQFGEKASLDAQSSKLAQDAMREAKKNQN